MGKALDIVAPIAGAVLGSTILPGIGFGITPVLGGAIGSGVTTGVIKKDPVAGLLGGLGTYAGNALGSALGGSLGNVGSAIGNTASNAVGPAFGSIGNLASSAVGGGAAGNILGAGLANASVGSLLGSYAGNSIGTSLADTLNPQQQPSGPPQFQPKQQAQAALPSSLSDFSSLSPLQQSTNLATQGVYGGGLGPEEQQYFLNLENRRLVDPAGQTASMDTLSPIENSYLAKLGLGGQQDTRSLLEAISQWGIA